MIVLRLGSSSDKMTREEREKDTREMTRLHVLHSVCLFPGSCHLVTRANNRRGIKQMTDDNPSVTGQRTEAVRGRPTDVRSSAPVAAAVAKRDSTPRDREPDTVVLFEEE